jgi:hypothetical protein
MKTEPTLESLIQKNQVVTGKTLYEQEVRKKRVATLFQEAFEIEERKRKSKGN